MAPRASQARLAALVLLLAAPGARGSNDLANERPPVRPAELERHWGVDCEGLRQALLAGTAATATQVDALRLCAAIHDPPGGTQAPPCPDYRGALRLLTAAGGTPVAPDLRRTLRCD